MKVEEEYAKKMKMRKLSIRLENNKGKRFWKWVWFYITYPFVWLFYNIRDWRTAIIFTLVFIIYSGSVWIFYLCALFCGWTATTTGKWLIGIGSTVWAWWLSPMGSPFILLCVSTTIGVKALFNKIFKRKEK